MSLWGQSRRNVKCSRKACGVGGSSEVIIKRLLEEWKCLL